MATSTTPACADAAAHAGDQHHLAAARGKLGGRLVGDQRQEGPRHGVARQRLRQVFADAEGARQVAVEVHLVAVAHHQHAHIGLADLGERIQRGEGLVDARDIDQQNPRRGRAAEIVGGGRDVSAPHLGTVGPALADHLAQHLLAARIGEEGEQRQTLRVGRGRHGRLGRGENALVVHPILAPRRPGTPPQRPERAPGMRNAEPCPRHGKSDRLRRRCRCPAGSRSAVGARLGARDGRALSSPRRDKGRIAAVKTRAAVAWEAGKPVMSTLPLEALLAFKGAGNLELCQHVICHNPARLPSPAAWVNVERIRLKDSFTHVWWLAKTPRPQADNRRVLTPYRKDMQRLLSSQKYNAGRRPSGHKISEKGFLTDHGGAIAPNVVDPENLPESMMRFSNTGWDAGYRRYCADHGLEPHPARMQPELAAFFIEFLTRPGDLVVDPFAGSNTTGAIAEALGRRWLSVEADAAYAAGSRGRFGAVANTQAAGRSSGAEAR